MCRIWAFPLEIFPRNTIIVSRLTKLSFMKFSHKHESVRDRLSLMWLDPELGLVYLSSLYNLAYSSCDIIYMTILMLYKMGSNNLRSSNIHSTIIYRDRMSKLIISSLHHRKYLVRKYSLHKYYFVNIYFDFLIFLTMKSFCFF